MSLLLNYHPNIPLLGTFLKITNKRLKRMKQPVHSVDEVVSRLQITFESM